MALRHNRISGLRDALIAAATLSVVVVLAARTAAFGWHEHAARPLTIAIGVTSGIVLLADHLLLAPVAHSSASRH
jgi:uncharacterized membrane protein YhiD involved in acid resistance